jgi:hypothetical protein
MFRGRFIGALLALLLIIGLFGLVGSSIYRAGWTQGYFVGKVSDGRPAAETTVVGPEAAPGRAVGPGYGFSSAGGFFAGIVKFFLLFFLVGIIFKFMGLLFWRKRGGWGHHRGCGHHHRWGHHGWGHNQGHEPPWYGDESDEPVMKA